MIEVQRLLKSFGYEVLDEDFYILGVLAERVRVFVRCFINCESLSESLEDVCSVRVCGQFLFHKLQTGKLDGVYDLEALVKSVKVGDTTTTFAISDGVATNEVRLKDFISSLMRYGEEEILSSRKMKW